MTKISRSSNQAAIDKKLKRLYGKHVTQIRRVVKKSTGEYAATCSAHGVIIEWVKDRQQREDAITEHLKGLYE